MLKSNYSIKKISLIYLLSLLPLIFFGFYKNGINLYVKKYVSVFGLLKPLLIILIGFIIGILVNLIYEKLIKKNKNKISDIIFSSFHPIYGILIAGISSININLLLFSIVTFIVLLISKFLSIKVNYVALCSLIILFIMNTFDKFTFLNIYEINTKFDLNTLDYMLGKGSGGIITTNILLLILSFIILYNIKTYKKLIPIISTVVFGLLVVCYSIYNNNIGNILNMLFTNGILFSYIYIAPETISSCYTKSGIIIYSILIGIITFLLYLINPALSSLGAILIVSIFNSLIDLKFE